LLAKGAELSPELAARDCPELKIDFGAITEDADGSLSDDALPDGATRGCVLIAMGGKLQCPNTLMKMLMFACDGCIWTSRRSLVQQTLTPTQF
jgi:hypothetical protein